MDQNSQRQEVADLLAVLDGVEGPDSKGQWRACCPAHDDRTPSLSVAVGERVGVVVHCFAGCTPEAVFAAVRARQAGGAHRGVLPVRLAEPKPVQVYDDVQEALRAARRSVSRPVQKERHYRYQDYDLQCVGIVVRYDFGDGTKTYRPLAKDSRGQWAVRAMDAPRVAYNGARLVLRRPDVAYVVEGEKCAEKLTTECSMAVTSAGGAQAAALTDWSIFVTTKTMPVILPDNDEAGERYAQDVLDQLKAHGVRQAKLVRLPGLPKGGDIEDFAASQYKTTGTWEDWLAELVEQAPLIALNEPPTQPGGDDPERAAIQDYEAEQEREIGAVPKPEDARRAQVDVLKDLPVRDQVIRGLASGFRLDEIPAVRDRVPGETTFAGRRFYDEQSLTTLPPVTWLIDGVIPEGQMAMIVAPPSTGKSLHVLEMAYSLAHGRPWRGRRVRGGGVMIYAGERLGGWNERSHAFRMHHGLPLQGMHRIGFVGGCPNLADVNWRRHEVELDILDWIRRYGRAPALVVIDTVSVALNGLSENDAESIAPVLRDLREVADRYGFTWLLVHHTGKAIPGQPVTGLDAIRGSSAFAGNLDAIYLLRPDGDGVVTMAAVKLSEGERKDEVTRSRIEVGPQGRRDAQGNLLLREDGTPLVSAYVVEITDEEAEQARTSQVTHHRETVREAVVSYLRQPQQMMVGVQGGVRALALILVRADPNLRSREVEAEIAQLLSEGAVQRVETGGGEVVLFLASAADDARARIAAQADRDLLARVARVRATSISGLAKAVGGKHETTRHRLLRLESEGRIVRDQTGNWVPVS
jgi:hypothetical protein